MTNFINNHVAPALIVEDPMLIERIAAKLHKQFIFAQRDLGRALVSALPPYRSGLTTM